LGHRRTGERQSVRASERESVMKKLLSRKDVAALIGETTTVVRRNEKRWGLDKARADLNSRLIRYRGEMVRLIFEGKGWI